MVDDADVIQRKAVFGPFSPVPPPPLTLCNNAPANVSKSAASSGVAIDAARCDHKHDIDTAAPIVGAVVIGNAVAEGIATTLARSDHQHAVSSAAPPASAVVIGNAAADGVAGTFARSDHQHAVVGATPPNTAVVIGNAAAEGVAGTFARSDHQHAVADGVPVSVNAANSAGVAGTFARSDHVHNSAPESKDWGATDVGTTAALRFLALGYAAVVTTDFVRRIVPRAGIMKNLRGRQQGAGVTAVTNSYTLRVNGVATAVSGSVSNTSIVAFSDLVNTVAVIAGDELSMGHTKSGAAGAGATNLYVVVEQGAAA